MVEAEQLQLFDANPAKHVGSAAILSDQWRLARVELVNWGTFSGYHILPVDRSGLLITGPSGSGKSSLLDAITTVLTPPVNRRLNAAALSEGSKNDRTICSYVRGAWRHETDETGQVAQSYLRPRVATWSGIMLRYESGHSYDASGKDQPGQRHEPIHLLVLFNLKANSNTNEGLSTLYALVRGDHSLREFEPYAVDGINSRSFGRDYKDVGRPYRDHAQFAHHFCRLMGIASPKTLVLLHKTQAAKNFGSLNDLFRKFMLDEPETTQLAEVAVEQFSALDQAYEGVVDQRKQMQHLEPLVELCAGHSAAAKTLEQLELSEQSLGSFTGKLVITCLEAERDALQREADRFAEAASNAANEQKRASTAYNQAQSSLNDAGGVLLQTAAADLLNFELRLNHVSDNKRSLAGDLHFAGIKEVPKSLGEWKALERAVIQKAQEAETEEQASKDSNYAAYGEVSALKNRRDTLWGELYHLRSQATNIPLKLHKIRTAIANHVGVHAAELPFVGELISVKPEHAPWQGAIERLLHQQAKTLLVAQRFAPAVAAFLEGEHVGLRFEYEAVPLEVEVPARSLSADSLVRKLSVSQARLHPEFSSWVNKDLRERFDYHCVDSAAELSQQQYALSIGGQIKRKARYIKDDRFRLDDQSNWILGSNNDDKIDTLVLEEARLAKALEQAQQAAEHITKQAQVTQNLVRLRGIIKDADWENYDEQKAHQDLEASQKHYDVLKQSNKKLSQAEAVFSEARARKEAADEALQLARVQEGSNASSLKKIQEDLHSHHKRLGADTPVPPQIYKQLMAQFKKVDSQFKGSMGAIYNASTKVQAELGEKKKSESERLQKTQSASERVLHDFKQSWPVVAADLSEDYADVDAYGAIYRKIKASGLPNYEQRFMKVLNDFSQDQITVLSSTIRGAFRVVKEKLVPVNRSLKLSEYAPGIHLQIEIKDNRSRQVTDFLSELQTINQGVWNEDNLGSAEERYMRTARIIKRFKSDEYADRKWKAECLDTRQHVSFIAKEIDANGNAQGVHSSDAGLSGGQKQKLVIFCLAAALRYQLADEDQPIPSYGTVILDEAFDKADHRFAATAMDIFNAFGFHMVLATPLKLLQTLESYIGAIASVHCEDSRRSALHLVSMEESEILPAEEEGNMEANE